MRKLSSVSSRCLFIVLAFTISVSAQQPFNKGEFEARRAKLFEKISDGIAVIFAAKEQFYPLKIRQSPDFYYLTGIEEANAVLVMIGQNKSTILFAPQRRPEQVRADGPGIWQVEKREEIYGLTGVQPIEEFLPSLQFLGLRAQKLYMLSGSQGNVTNSREELDFFELLDAAHSALGGLSESKKTIAVMREVLPHLTFQSLNPFLDDMRWIKSPYEIELMKKSCEIGAEGVKEAMKGTRPGMYEYELEAAARYVYVKRGARGDAFLPIVASGRNTLIFHYNKNNRKMQAGEVVYMDYGADYDYYVSDITRTWPVGDKFTPSQEKMYRCILEARAAIIAAIKPGAVVADLQNAAAAVYKKHGFEKEFEAFGRYVGHPVGISVHDVGEDDW